MTLDWQKIQDKWQKKWAEAELGKATVQNNKPKFMMIFAYPGVSGFLHVGHMRGFSYTDAICRFERLKGKEVLFPVGTHASGNQAIAFANKIKNKDETWIKYLKDNGCSQDKINELNNPEKIIEYFNEVYVNEYWKKFGFLCDWDRFTSTTNKDYEKFIQWQFKKLQKKDLLIQKPYFATACIVHGPVAVDPSETDISKGGNAEKNEYTLLKFKLNTNIPSMEDDYLVAATLRPETIYGQTNLWINPNAKYVRVQVDNENWIMSKQAANKLKYQKDDVLLKEDIFSKDLIGKKALAPGIEIELPILPADICNPSIGTGIVTCVPAHAPHDWIALKDIQNNEHLSEIHNLNYEEIEKIKPISILKVKGWGDFPAKEICERDNITSQDQVEKLELAKKEIYKAEHHGGVMKENCGKYFGKKVQEVKELMKSKLIEEGKADVFHDLSEDVLCRCGEQVIIKRIDDQWFIKYSDQELTNRAKEHAKNMKIFPDEYYENFQGVLDWFQDRACVRLGNWLGSKFPFDDKWTVEPISDSTLYPAYYIVSKFVNTGILKTKDLTEEFFDYIFLNVGENVGEAKEKWKQIQEEFDYFYPLDLNLGGKEHKTVHFPVFVMNHVAILPKEKWPKGMFVNWWVTGKGSKISKSKGGAKPIPQAIEKYGVDAMRLYYAHIGSPHVDVVWDETVVMNYKGSLEKIYYLIQEARRCKQIRTETIDKWLASKFQRNLKKINEAMETYNLREFASVVYFTMYDDLRWYLRRGGENKKFICMYTNDWCRLLNPITPHISEELYDFPGLVSECLSGNKWPPETEKALNITAEAGEDLIKTVMEGMRNVIKLAKLDKPSKFSLYFSEEWKYKLFNILSREIKVTRNVGEVMKKVLEDTDMKTKNKEVSKIVLSVLKDVSKLPLFILSRENEVKAMKDAKKFLENEFDCDVEISDKNSEKAMPGKIGILVE